MKKTVVLVLLVCLSLCSFTGCVNSGESGKVFLKEMTLPETVDTGSAVKLPSASLTGGKLKNYTVNLTALTPNGETVRANNKNVIVFGHSGEYTVTYKLLKDGNVADSKSYTVTARHKNQDDVLLRGFETQAETETIRELFGGDGGAYRFALNSDGKYVSQGESSLKVYAAKEWSVDRAAPWPVLSLFGEPKAGTSVDASGVPHVQYTDLSEYATIDYDVMFVSGSPAYAMTNIISEAESEMWDNVYNPVEGKWQHISIPCALLSETQRQTMHTLGISMFEAAADMTYYIDNVRLVRAFEEREKIIDFEVETDVDKVLAEGAKVSFTEESGGVLEAELTGVGAVFTFHSINSAINSSLSENKRTLQLRSLLPYSAFELEVSNISGGDKTVALTIKIGDESYASEPAVIAAGRTQTVTLDLIAAAEAGVDLFSFAVNVPEGEPGYDGFISMTVNGSAYETFSFDKLTLVY